MNVPTFPSRGPHQIKARRRQQEGCFHLRFLSGGRPHVIETYGNPQAENTSVLTG